jgi:hypothetical protein
LKGEERVCHVTEADTPGAKALDVSEEVSSCEAARIWGLAPVRGGVRRFPAGPWFRAAETPGIKRKRRASGGCLGTERR